MSVGLVLLPLWLALVLLAIRGHSLREDVDFPKSVLYLPDAQAIFLWYVQLLGRVGDHIVGDESVVVQKLLSVQGWDYHNEGCQEFCVHEILRGDRWFDEDIGQIAHIVVAPGLSK